MISRKLHFTKDASVYHESNCTNIFHKIMICNMWRILRKAKTGNPVLPGSFIYVWVYYNKSRVNNNILKYPILKVNNTTNWEITLLWKCQTQQLMHQDTFNRIITAQWEDVGSARYELALRSPCPTIRVLSFSNCQRSTLDPTPVNFQKFCTLRVNSMLHTCIRWVRLEAVTTMLVHFCHSSFDGVEWCVHGTIILSIIVAAWHHAARLVIPRHCFTVRLTPANTNYHHHLVSIRL